MALALARRLPPSTRAELVALIVRELVDAPSVTLRRLTPNQARAPWPTSGRPFRRCHSRDQRLASSWKRIAAAATRRSGAI
jgi:hypothetical protein